MTESDADQRKEGGSGIFMSRRRFWKGAARVGLLATVVGTVGCLEGVGDYIKKRKRDDRKISLGELKKLGKVDVYYPNGSTVELYATDYPYNYYDNSGYQVFFEGKDGNIVLDPPKISEKFSNKIVLHGSDQFRANVESMLDVMSVYSPEWFEKTLYAGEVVIPYHREVSTKNGAIGLNVNVVKELGKNADIKRILSYNARLPHELWHVIDQNLDFENYLEDDIPLITSGVRTGFELELRAGIADADYTSSVSKKFPEFYEFLKIKELPILQTFNTETIDETFYMWRRHRYKEDREKVEKEFGDKYKTRLDKIEGMYFDHENKKLKTDFLDESWKKFRNL